MNTSKIPAAVREIEALNRSFIAGDYTADEHAAALESVLSRHGVAKRIIAAYANGIRKVQITDANGDVIAEYHEGQ